MYNFSILSQELNYICKFMVPSCVKLLNRIVEEEGLTIEYEICIDSRLAIGMIPRFKFIYKHLTCLTIP
jgi:hypothetical protein